MSTHKSSQQKGRYDDERFENRRQSRVPVIYQGFEVYPNDDSECFWHWAQRSESICESVCVTEFREIYTFWRKKENGGYVNEGNTSDINSLNLQNIHECIYLEYFYWY